MCKATIKKAYIAFVFIIGFCLIDTNPIVAAYQTDVVSDMALIYQGGTHRPDWTEDELLPYVTHTFADGRIDWFFDSFLFFEFTDNWQIAFGYKYGSRNAKKSDWEWLLNRVFEKGKSIDALNACIERHKKIIGEPQFKHKIVLGIVSPITDQSDWGSLDGTALNFAYKNDQIKAAKWYIDQLMKRFEDGAYNNLELVGFYWLEESTAKCGDLPKYVSEYIHQLDKRFYWIPYWYAPGFEQWKELGFDVAFLQPNHFFDTSVIDARLRDACKLAKKTGMGLELEFDSKVLYESSDSYYSRLETYIKYFEEYGVFDQSTIAYYSGTKAILDMYNSHSIENTLILDRIANHILERRHNGVGVERVDDSKSDIAVHGGVGELYVSGEIKYIKVYSINGVLVSENAKRFACAPGIYIVIVDGETHKVIVR